MPTTFSLVSLQEELFAILFTLSTGLSSENCYSDFCLSLEGRLEKFFAGKTRPVIPL